MVSRVDTILLHLYTISVINHSMHSNRDYTTIRR